MEAMLKRELKLLLPIWPWKCLYLTVYQWRKTALHESYTITHLFLNLYGVGASPTDDVSRSASHLRICPTISTSVLLLHTSSNRVNIGPTWPVPIILPFSEVTGNAQNGVPVMNASSAVYTSY